MRSCAQVPWGILAGLVLVGGCTPDGHTGDALERARTSGLRAGFSIEPPYAFVDSAGEPTGEAPEILRYVSRELGIEDVQWFPLPFEELIPAVLGGRIDVVASGLFVTLERTRQVRFSRPTACVQPALVLKGEDRRRDRASGAADCPDCRIAVIKGGVEEAVLERYEPSKWEAKPVPDLATAVAAVEDGSADALAISAPTARTIVRAQPALVLDRRTLPEAVAQEAQGCAALAFRPADGELVEAFDSVLETFVGSPGHLQIVVPFGFTRAELPCAGSPAASSAGSTGECSAGGAPK